MKFAVAALLALAAASRAAGGDIDSELERLAMKNGVAGAGACALRVEPPETLGARRGDEMFPLASVTKLFTACAALEALGPDAEFVTRLWVLRGKDGEAALVAVGGGDPAISGRDFGGNPCAVFERWAEALHDAGIRKITRIDLDETRFGSDHIGEDWPVAQLHEWYSAPAGALALNDDCVEVTVSAGKAGEAAVVRASPDTAYVKIENRCTMTGDKSQHVVQVWRKPGSNTISISGKFLVGAGPLTESVTIEDPARYFGTVLRETLVRKGLDAKDAPLNVLKQPFEPSFADGQPLVHAVALRDAFRVMLQRSQNFYAEQTVRVLGPRGGTVKEAIAAARKPLAALGLAEADFAWLDGSGLSRGNRASPATVAKLLAAAAKRPWGQDLWNSMAIPGAEGTLSKRLAGLENVMRGKTGTIAGVSNLAGYVDTKSGRVAFAVLCSQLKEGSPPAMRFEDDVARMLSTGK